MNKRRPGSDDVLFISALAALLLGAALLLYTTGTFDGILRGWPFLVMALGGVLLYLHFLRGASFSVLLVGLFCVLEGAFILAATLVGWKLAKAWPLGMAIAGLSGILGGILARKRLKAALAVPSFSFVALGLAFSIFSLGWAKVGFKSFIAVWWPSLLIAGGVSLFVAYGYARRGSSKRPDAAKERSRARPGKTSAGRPGRDRGPSSGT
jgi:hypothetical protein